MLLRDLIGTRVDHLGKGGEEAGVGDVGVDEGTAAGCYARSASGVSRSFARIYQGQESKGLLLTMVACAFLVDWSHQPGDVGRCIAGCGVSFGCPGAVSAGRNGREYGALCVPEVFAENIELAFEGVA
jgi:hypothetical protein